MALNKYLQKFWKSPEKEALMKERMIAWRKEPVVLRLEHPTRLDRAHSLGYKAKQGIIVVRTKIKKGTRKREARGGKKPAHQGMTGIGPNQNLQHIAEMRVAKNYPNMEVLNSYYLTEDGKRKWFEIILVDPINPSIVNDPDLKWLQNPANRGRVFRGLTSAGKKSRGLRSSGKGAEKVRPSRRANAIRRMEKSRKYKHYK